MTNQAEKPCIKGCYRRAGWNANGFYPIHYHAPGCPNADAKPAEAKWDVCKCSPEQERDGTHDQRCPYYKPAEPPMKVMVVRSLAGSGLSGAIAAVLAEKHAEPTPPPPVELGSEPLTFTCPVCLSRSIRFFSVDALKAERDALRNENTGLRHNLEVERRHGAEAAEQIEKLEAERDAIAAQVKTYEDLILDIAAGQEDGHAEARAIRARRKESEARRA